MLGLKTFRCVSILLAGVETIHNKKRQLERPKAQASTVAAQF